MAAPLPDGLDPDLRIIQCSNMLSTDMLRASWSLTGVIQIVVKELLQTIPRPDFIEIRAIRYEPKEEDNGGSARAVPDA